MPILPSPIWTFLHPALPALGSVQSSQQALAGFFRAQVPGRAWAQRRGSRGTAGGWNAG